MLDQIIDLDIDSSETAYFYSLLYKAKKDNNINKLANIKYLKFFTNNTIRVHPHKSRTNGILFPVKKVAKR